MKTCPVCDTPFSDENSHCPTDGAALILSRELQAGRTVRGKYRILNMIGRGGMGEVYLAEHLMLGGRLALKFLAPELSQSPRFIKRFRLEAKAAYQLKHPNIVEVVDLDQDENGTLFIAMEYVQGASLRSILSRYPSGLPPLTALNFARDVAAGLAAAHDRGIIHRDIKPENILIAHQKGVPDCAKVLDFGIAAMSEGITDVSRTHGVLLTPEYASPEQWRGTPANELDCRADLYALGGVLYEMLAGCRPHKATNSEGWMYQHLYGEYTPLAALRPDLESQFRGLGQVVDQLLAREREERLSCAEALLEELDHILDAAPAAAAETSGPGATLFEEQESVSGSTGIRSRESRSGSRPSGGSGDYSRQRTSGTHRTTGPRDSRAKRASGEWAPSVSTARSGRSLQAAPAKPRRWAGRIAIVGGILAVLVAGGFAWLHWRPLPATAVPSLSPAPGAYSQPIQVMISDTTPGAVIHFTTDGSAPSTTSQTYSGAISEMNGEVHLRAIAISPGHSASPEAEGIYLVSVEAQGTAATKPSPSMPPQPVSAGPQTANGNSEPPPVTANQAAAKLSRTPSADSGRLGNPAAQAQPPVQPPQKATNPIRPTPETAPVQMQEISSTEADGMIVSRTMPVYPAAAQARGVSGTVILDIVISTSGSVSRIDPVSGPLELQQAAMNAVRTWRYRPYIIQGRAVPVATTVRMAFNLR
jgi:TonB family protein